MLNLGTIQFGLAIDTRALNAAVNRVKAFGSVVEATQRAANRGLDTNIQAFRRQENAMLSAMEKLRNATNQISKANIAPNLKTDMLVQANRLYNDLTKNIGQAGKVADATKFDRSLYSFRSGIGDVVREVQNLARAQTSAAATSEVAILRQANAYERAAERVRNLNAQIERSRLNTDSKTSLTAGPDSALAGLKGSLMGGGALSTKDYSVALNTFNKQLGDSRRLFQSTTAQSNSLTSSMEVMRNNIRSLGSGFLLLNGHLGGMSTRMFALSSIASNTSVAFAAAASVVVGFGLAMGTLGRGSIQATIQLEKASKALEAVYGNSIDAALGIDYVRKISDQAGISFNETARSYARYVAGAQSVKQTLAETQNQFQIISLAAGKLSLGVEDTQGVFRALEQIMSKGTVQSEELRGQLGDRLPQAFAIAATAMGKTTAELSAMLKKGEVISSDFVPKFVKALQQAYNIDVGASVDTTQASITRLSNAVIFLYGAFAENTGVVQTFKGIVEGLTSVINYASENMGKLINMAVGVAGAVIGATTGLLALRTALFSLAVLESVIAWTASFIALARTAASATELWALATMGLNAAIAANPVGAILSILARVAVVVAGAALGYKLFTDAVQVSNDVLSDTSGIEEWISAQQKFRTATDESVRALYRQQKATATTAETQARAAVQAARDDIKALKDFDREGIRRSRLAGDKGLQNMYNILSKEAATSAAKAKEAASAYTLQARALTGLATVINSPMGEIEAPSLDISGTKGDTSKAQNNIDNILDIIDAYKTAQDKLRLITQASNPADIALVDDIMNARQELRRMSSEELTMAEAALKAAGLSTNNLETDLARLMTTIRTTEEQTRAFTRALEKIDRASIDMSGMQKAIDFLQGGGSPDQLYLLEAAAEAEDLLRKLDAVSLEGIRKKLEALGFSAQDAQTAMAAFLSSGEQSKGLIDALSEINNAMREANDRLRDSVALAEAYSHNAWTGEAAEKVMKNVETIRTLERRLEALGKLTPEMRKELQALYETLSDADAAEEGLKKIKDQADQTKQSFYDLADSFASNIMSMIEGTKSLGKALTDTLMGFVLETTENALKDLFKDAIDSIMGKGGKSRSQAEAIQKNIGALDKNTVALLALSRSIGANATTGSGGGGLLGGLLDIGMSIFGGGLDIPLFSGAGGDLDLSGLNFGDIPWQDVNLSGRALGGPVTAGKAYRVSEQGAGDEIFFPGVSGNVVPTSKMGGGKTVVHYDGTTVIHANGASKQTVEELRALIAERDARLRAEIPYIIDNRTQENAFRLRSTY